MRSLLAVAVLVGVAVGCPASEPVPAPLHTPQPWEWTDTRLAPEHPFFDDHPGLVDLSTWSTAVSGPTDERPDHQERGPFALGNGRVAGFVGLADPVHRLHAAIGPVVEQRGGFFGDMGLEVLLDGQPLEWEAEWVARPRGAAVVITRADGPEGSLYTIDLAPRPAGEDPPPVFLRFALVTLADGVAGPVSIGLDHVRSLSQEDGILAEVVGEDERFLAPRATAGEFAQSLDGGWSVPLGTLEAGGSTWTAVALGTGFTRADAGAAAELAVSSDPEQWLDDTLAWWREWRAGALEVELDDPRLVDLYDALLVGIRAQQTDAGAVIPVSRYTRTWLRDTIGPVRSFLRAGLAEDATRAVDYLYACHSARGDIANSCTSALLPGEQPPPPDWAALGPFSGRQAAEGPSYLALMYRELLDWTGDSERAAARWPYLRRALLAQQVEEDGRQPFSGDETFRLALQIAHGYDLSLLFEEETWSANSAWLLAAGRRRDGTARG